MKSDFFSLNSTYGRANLVKSQCTMLKKASTMVRAVERNLQWSKRIRKTDLAGVRLTKKGVDATFIVDANTKTTKYTNLQAAVAILDNSKMQLCKMQHLVSRLYDMRNITNMYRYGRTATVESSVDRHFDYFQRYRFPLHGCEAQEHGG